MQNPRNLQVADEARALAALTYRLTRSFPKQEIFGLTAQMRRAAVSIGSNIWEGCGRSGNRELIAFLHVSMGSASELEFQALVASDVGLWKADDGAEFLEAVRRLKSRLSRLIVSIRKHEDNLAASNPRTRKGRGS